MLGCAGVLLGDAKATKDVGHFVNAATSKPMAKQANNCSATAASRVGNPGFIVDEKAQPSELFRESRHRRRQMRHGFLAELHPDAHTSMNYERVVHTGDAAFGGTTSAEVRGRGGAVLIAINHGDALLRGDVDLVRMGRMGLTVLVPSLVSTLSSVGATRELSHSLPPKN